VKDREKKLLLLKRGSGDTADGKTPGGRKVQVNGQLPKGKQEQPEKFKKTLNEQRRKEKFETPQGGLGVVGYLQVCILPLKNRFKCRQQ